MLRLEADKMRKAIERAKAVHPKVRVINASERIYAVIGSTGRTYTVRFVVVNGMRLAECDCAARGMCFHIASAAAVNMGVQSMRQGTKVPTADRMQAFIARNTGWLV